MKARAPSLDGFAVQNTRNVFVALDAYEQKMKTGGTRGEAVAVAATVYESVSGKRTTSRTVRRWLGVAKSYGGAAKTPSNAFGARKSCPHVVRPARDLVRQIKAAAARIGSQLPGNDDSRAVAELAVASQLLGDVLAAARHNTAARHLVAIKALASRLANIPVYHLHRFTSASEMEDALRAILARLRGITATGAKAA